MSAEIVPQLRYVILNGGEAGVRDRTTVQYCDDAGGNMLLLRPQVIFVTAVVVPALVRSLGALFAPQDDIGS